MEKLSLEGKYEITEAMKKGLKDFYAGFQQTKKPLKV